MSAAAHISGTLVFADASRREAAEAVLRGGPVPVSVSRSGPDGLTLDVSDTWADAGGKVQDERRPWRVADWVGGLCAAAKQAAGGALEVRFDDARSRGLRVYAGGHPAFLHESDRPADAFDRETYRAPDGTANATSPFRAVALSPDGRLCAFAGGDNFSGRGARVARCGVILADASTGTEIRRLYGHSGIVKSLAFSPDGAALALGDNDQGLRTYDVAAGVVLQGRKPPIHLYGPPSGPRSRSIMSKVSAVCFLPDGRLVSAGGTRIGLWEVGRLKLRQTLEGHEDEITHLAASADGQHLCSVGAPSATRRLVPQRTTGSLVLWDLRRPAPVRSRPGLFVDAVFAPDGRTLAVLEGFDGPESPFENFRELRIPASSAFFRKRLSLLDRDSLEAVWSIDAEGNPQRLAFAEDRRTLYGVGIEGAAVVLRGWTADRGRPVLMRPHPHPLPEGLVFRPPADFADAAGRSWHISGEACTGLVRRGDVLAAVTPDAVRLFRRVDGQPGGGRDSAR
jgi:hypothetical protein